MSTSGLVFLQDLADRVAIASKDPKWVDKLVEKGHSQIDGLEPEARAFAEAGLAVLETRRADVAGLAAGTFISVSHSLALGKVDEARRAWLADYASHADRMSALDAAMGAALDAAQRRAEQWERVKDVALAFLKAAGQVAIPLLMAAI